MKEVLIGILVREIPTFVAAAASAPSSLSSITALWSMNAM